jgi:hypothetical protein
MLLVLLPDHLLIIIFSLLYHPPRTAHRSLRRRPSGPPPTPASAKIAAIHISHQMAECTKIYTDMLPPIRPILPMSIATSSPPVVHMRQATIGAMNIMLHHLYGHT